jgi:hypothetical protein
LARKVVKVCLIPDLGVQARRVGDIVAVHASGTRHEKGRCVAIADSKVLKVVQQSGSVTKGEKPVQLQTVGRAGNVLEVSLNSLRHGRRCLLSQNNQSKERCNLEPLTKPSLKIRSGHLSGLPVVRGNRRFAAKGATFHSATWGQLREAEELRVSPPRTAEPKL